MTVFETYLQGAMKARRRALRYTRWAAKAKHHSQQKMFSDYAREAWDSARWWMGMARREREHKKRIGWML